MAVGKSYRMTEQLVVRDTARKALGVLSKQRKEDTDTWWWDEEVQESIRKKMLANKRWDMQRDKESNQEYKEMRREAKKEVVKAKNNAYDELYEGLILRKEKRHCTDWRDRDTNRKGYVQHIRMMKSKDGKLMTDE